MRQFTQSNVPSGHQGATIGVDFMIKTVVVNDCKVKLQLWDTAGQERFRSITQSYYRSAHCLVLVYDISSQPSFDALTKWVRDVDDSIDRSDSYNGAGASQQVLRVLVGNKSDKEREIPISIGEKFADVNNFDIFMETSALDNRSVDRLFMDIAEMLTLRRHSDENQALASQLIGGNQPSTDQERTNTDRLSVVDQNFNNMSARARNCLQC